MSYSTIQLTPGRRPSDGMEFLSPFHGDIDEDDLDFFHYATHSSSRRNSTEQSTKGKSSKLATGFNFVNSIVGAGIIGIPVAIKECGLFMGIFLLVLVAYLVDQSVILLIDCGVRAKKNTYEDLCQHLLGTTGYNICVISMLLFAYGAMLAYLVILGDTVPIAFEYFLGEESAPSRNTVIIVSALFPILPLCLMRSLSSLSYTSLLSITADLVLVIFIVIRGRSAARKEDTTFTSEDVTFMEYHLFEGIGTMSFAFVCHHNTFIVYNSLQNANLRSWKTVSHSSIFSAFVLCLFMGLAGFLSFGAYTEGDVLNNFPDSDRVILVGRLLLAVTMVFTYPLECFVARHSLYSFLVNVGCMSHHDTQEGDERGHIDRIDDIIDQDYNDTPANSPQGEEESNLPLSKHLSFTLGLWGTTLLFSLLVSDLHLILALTGAVAASFLAYILPALLYAKTFETQLMKALAGFDNQSNHFQPNICHRFRKLRRFVFPCFLFIFGMLSLVIGVGTVIFDIVEH